MSFKQFLQDNYRIYSEQNGEIRIDCPFCDDTKGHGYANETKNVYICHRCHASHYSDRQGHTAYSFLRAEGLDHRETVRILAGGNGAVLRERVVTLPDLREVPLPESYTPLYQKEDKSLLGRMAANYFSKRLGKKARSIASHYGVGYCSGGKMAGRIIFPVWIEGVLYYYQARAFFPTGLQPKYMAPSSPKPIFGLEGARPGMHLTLVEGWLDKVALGDGCCAVFGSSLSDLQLHMLLRAKASGYTICFDPDEAGQKGAEEVAQTLVLWTGCKDIYIVRGMESDPADLGDRAIYSIRQNSVRVQHNFF